MAPENRKRLVVKKEKFWWITLSNSEYWVSADCLLKITKTVQRKICEIVHKALWELGRIFSYSYNTKIVSSAPRPATKQLALPIFHQHISYLNLWSNPAFQPCRIHPRSSASAPAEPRRSTLFFSSFGRVDNCSVQDPIELNRTSLLHIV